MTLDVSNGNFPDKDEWLIQETILITEEKPERIKQNRILNCKPEKPFYHNVTYFWSHMHPKGRFHELKNVRRTLTFIAGGKMLHCR